MIFRVENIRSEYIFVGDDEKLNNMYGNLPRFLTTAFFERIFSEDNQEIECIDKLSGEKIEVKKLTSHKLTQSPLNRQEMMAKVMGPEPGRAIIDVLTGEKFKIRLIMHGVIVFDPATFNMFISYDPSLGSIFNIFCKKDSLYLETKHQIIDDRLKRYYKFYLEDRKNNPNDDVFYRQRHDSIKIPSGPGPEKSIEDLLSTVAEDYFWFGLEVIMECVYMDPNMSESKKKKTKRV